MNHKIYTTDKTSQRLLTPALRVLAKKAVKKALEAPKEADEVQITEINYAKELENKVRRALGRKVKINAKGREKSIKIYFEDNEDLDELLTLLGGGSPISL